MASALRRGRAHLNQRRRSAGFAARLNTTPRNDLIAVGDLGYGGYLLPATLLGPDSVCYLAGTGEDISFDLGVIARFGCEILAMDPVPRAAEHVAVAAAHEPRFHFMPVALWSEDTTLTFHAPRENGYVSQSAVNLHHTTPDFKAPARSVASLMAELGHDRIDLLKISAEGSEYEILEHVAGSGIDVRVLCVEYAQPAAASRAQGSVDMLRRAGYVLVAASVRTWNWKLTFVGPRAS
ncbi:MAG TPA: FkbM family methyltransferase [Solirubrobacteraceae bacterium]|nr:FkbM family methyltransferase [Solirubrobacteraceae bacterium]